MSTGFSLPPQRRRDLLRAGGVVVTAGTAGVLATSITTASAAPSYAATAAPRPSADTGISLRRTSTAGIRVAEVDLAVRARSRSASAPWTSARMRTDAFSLLGFSWPAHAPTPVVEVRYATAGAWTDWRSLPTFDDRPDPGDEATLRHATHPLWVGSADAVQVRVSGHRPARIVMSLIQSEAAAADRAPGARSGFAARETPSARERRTATGRVARPAILTRADWSANESWRDGSARYNDTIQQVHVHHTVSGNDYARDDTAALIRGMYYYHTHTLGWSDIGYNFLVDRFGRIWEGRAGGIGKSVRGAHTLGFNATSAGVSVIGNFEQVKPSEGTLDAVAGVAAWKLSRFGRDPQGTTMVVSEGSDKFARSKTATLPVIDGHRDTNDTACPGANLYARLADIRSKAADLVKAAAVSAVTITADFTVVGDAVPGSTLTVAGGTYTPSNATVTYQWLRDGVAIRRSTKATRRVSEADLGRLLSVVVTVSSDGLQSAVRQVDLPGPVRRRPDLTLRTKVVGTRVRVVLKVSAEGVTDPGGTATIRVDARVKTVAVVDGKARATFVRPAGAHPVRVAYSGSATVAPGSAETSVTTA